MRAINLLPKDEKRKGIGAGVSTPVSLTAVIGAVVVTALLCGLFLSAHGKVTERQATLDGLQHELSAIPTPAADAVARSDALAADKKARIDALNVALSRRVAWDRVLREFAMVLPEDVWLMSLSGDAPTASTTATTAPAASSGANLGSDGSVMFQIEGFTYSQNGVARLLSRLQVIPDFQNVQLLSSETQTRGGRKIVHFRLGADIRPPGGVAQ
jgi:Tfp pilus assembly protein PilN